MDYFVLHAPRQTGKTSTLQDLQDLLNSGSCGNFRCVHVNVEAGQAAHGSVTDAVRAVLDALGMCALQVLGDNFVDKAWPGFLDRSAHTAILRVLGEWASASPQPIVLLIDEIDSLVGDGLLSVLLQLRSGYERRPEWFPYSIALCGLRDTDNYRVSFDESKESPSSGSPFNIIADSLRLGDFTRPEVEELLGQHTRDTGQAFQADALDRVWTQTQGQPWLVNALCDESCFRSETGRRRGRAITEGDIIDAQERLILRRPTHFHQLGERLRDARVRSVIEPLISGSDRPEYSDDDLSYARDLGLVATDSPVRIANPIYREVVPRELTAKVQRTLHQRVEWYLDAKGGLDLGCLLEAFQKFFREHSEFWIDRFLGREAGPHLLLQAFLQRVVNGGGHIEREYAQGRGRVDLLVDWPRGEIPRRFLIECKVVRDSPNRTRCEGLQQISGYMDRSGADEGHLLLFDSRERSWADKVFREKEEIGAHDIHVWGL